MNENYNQCPICLSNARLPVATRCGHIFCWECIKSWVNSKGKMECPSCKSGFKLNEVVKLYTGNNEKEKGEVDDRPQQKRSEAQYVERSFLHRVGNNFGLFGYTNDTIYRPPTQKEVQRNYVTMIVFILIIAFLIYIIYS